MSEKVELRREIIKKDKEIKRLNNKVEELMTLYTTEREVKDYYKNVINKLEKNIKNDNCLYKEEKEYMQDNDRFIFVDDILDMIDRLTRCQRK